MRPTAKYGTITGDLHGNKIDMSIDTSAMAHIMSILTDLYSDPAMAVIREYSTNALDAHIEAGNDEPIVLSRPTALRPFFTVTDSGVGLSVDQINTIYSRYGASTKRDTDDQTGMLGLGCKSGLTYAAQFTVTAVKNGVRCSVVVSRREDGTGIMEVVDTRSTTESNGVSISIPVSNISDFNNKIDSFLLYLPPSTYRIDGHQPTWLLDKATQITDGIYSVPNYVVSSDQVVMGNVAYALPERTLLSDVWYRKFSIVSFVPMGAVNIAPSREALMMTEQTKKQIAHIQAQYVENVLSAAHSEIANAATASEAFRAIGKWTRQISDMGSRNISVAFIPEWHGERLAKQLTFEGKSLEVNHTRYAVESRPSVRAEFYNDYAVVEGFDKTDISTTDRRKIRAWATENHPKINKVLIGNVVDDVRLADMPRASWNDIRKIKFASNGQPGTGVSLTGTQRIFTGYNQYGYRRRGEVQSMRMDSTKLAGKTLFYCEADFVENLRINWDDDGGDRLLVLIHKTRWPNFLAMFPHAVNYKEWRQAEHDKQIAALTDDDKTWHVHSSDWSMLRHLRGKGTIDDPEVAHFVQVMINGESAAVKEFRKFGSNHGLRDVSFDVQNPLDRYPLADYTAVMSHPTETIEYINLVFGKDAS